VSGNGAYLILKRDDSKKLQSLEADSAVREYVDGLRQSKAYRTEGLLVDCGDCWDPIHRCLAEGKLDPEAGDFPLNHFVLGGKRLYRGPGFHAVLIRPDIVPHVADLGRDFKRSDFHDRYFALDPADFGRSPCEREFDRIWGVFRQVQQLFDDAAADRAAVLFTVSL
jgi:hypothetical protein